MVEAENRRKLARQALDAVGTRDQSLIGEVEEKTVTKAELEKAVEALDEL